ncbi:MAG: site-specific integrase, partial [Phycisphaerales bacterium]
MPRLSVKVPKYRLHKPSGRAVVTLEGKDFYLGEYGSPESKAEYNRLVAEWQMRGRNSAGPVSSGVVIDEVISAYLVHVEQYYVKHGKPTSSQDEARRSLQILHEQYGQVVVTDFGPLMLKALREDIINQRRWCRTTVNKAISIVKRMFKWASENEIVSAEIYHRLQTVSGLRRGRSAARESDPIRPAPEDQIEAVIQSVSAPVAAMIQLQRLTGMRPEEVVSMRRCDLDCSGKPWIYTPASHKTEHHQKQRRIFIGPKAQQLLMPLLNVSLESYLFSPTDAERQRRRRRHVARKTPRSCGNRPGTNRKQSPQWKPGDRYTTGTYRRAISRACQQVFPPPKHLARAKVPGKKGLRWETDAEWNERLGEKKWLKLKAWQKAHHWHPNQLRHNAATYLRKEFGIEAARVV